MDHAFSGLRVLIVEDQAESRAALKDILTDMGVMDVFEAGDGHYGLQMMSHADGGIDLVLCDWNMPVMSGLELFRAVRELGNATPFLIVTGRGDHPSVLEARSTGVDGYIRKPFSPQQIETRLRIIAARMEAA